MTQTTKWYDADKVKQPGSVILTNWRREREQARSSRSTVQNFQNGSLSMSEFANWIFGETRRGSTHVSEYTAMCISTVYACVALIGGSIASMPLNMFRRVGADDDDDRKRIKPDEWWMLNESFYPCWPAAAAWEYIAWSKVLLGDAFVRMHRASRMSNRIVGFEPLHPNTVQVARVGDELYYKVAAQPSQSKGSVSLVEVGQEDMLHVPGPGFNGLRGMSQISSVLAGAGGIALGAGDHTRAFFENSARPDFVLQTDGELKQDKIDQLRAQWNDLFQGATRSWKPAVLAGGLKVQPITMNAHDAQLLETRKFQVEDICRIFGVPPHMVGHTEKTTSWGSGVEAMGIGFVKYTLQRHLVAFEQEINRKVFRNASRFCEFATVGLERGDTKTRYDAYRTALGRAGEKAWMTVNEVRKAENMSPVDGGDELENPSDPNEPANDPAEGTNGAQPTDPTPD
jgi:HK97 family phage portal protein